MIYTSYFAKLKYYQSNNLSPLRISNGGRNIVEHKVNSFIPEWKIVDAHKKRLIDNEAYKRLYLLQLSSFIEDPKLNLMMESILSSLNQLNAVLLCYEKPEKFCHRHILAEWIKDNFGYNVIEFP